MSNIPSLSRFGDAPDICDIIRKLHLDLIFRAYRAAISSFAFDDSGGYLHLGRGPFAAVCIADRSGKPKQGLEFRSLQRFAFGVSTENLSSGVVVVKSAKDGV